MQGLWPERREVQGRGRTVLLGLFSSNTDIQVGDVPKWLRSSSSCILRARMSDTVVLRSLDDSITAGEMQQTSLLRCWIMGSSLVFQTGSS